MVTQATSAGKIKKGGKHAKKIKSETNPTASTDDGHIYVIDCLNLVKLHMTQTVTRNDSLCKVGKIRWKIRRIVT